MCVWQRGVGVGWGAVSLYKFKFTEHSVSLEGPPTPATDSEQTKRKPIRAGGRPLHHPQANFLTDRWGN